MGWSNWYVVKILVIVGAAIAISIDGVHGDATVSGMVFCDQCKDDHISLFDYPLHGIKVLMACPGQDGHLRVVGEETTNWLGGYVMQFEGASDLSSCRTQVADSGQGCGAVAGPAQRLKLIFEFFDTEMYTVDPLLSQPAQPMSFCRRSPSPVPTPVTPAPPLPPPAGPPPVYHPPPTPRLPSLPPPAAPQLPPLPSMPPMPSLPFLEASACPYW